MQVTEPRRRPVSPAGPQSNQNVWVLPPISRNVAECVACALNLVDHVDLKLACIQPRFCGEREWGVFDPSSVCLFQTSTGFWRERGVYCRLHSQSRADTVPPPSLPVTSSIVATRKPQVRSRRALWRFSCRSQIN